MLPLIQQLTPQGAASQNMSHIPERPPKVSVSRLLEQKRERQPITVVTAYDFPTARLADEAGVDAILVGDSLAMVVLGHPNTLSVTCLLYTSPSPRDS